MTGDIGRRPSPPHASASDGESGANLAPGHGEAAESPTMKLAADQTLGSGGNGRRTGAAGGEGSDATAEGSTGAASVGPGSPGAAYDISDEALVQRLRDGDVAAGETLVARHHAALMRYLQRLVGAEAAEELHQQTWLSVLDHVDRFDPTVGASAGTAGSNSAAGGTASGFKAWLFRIATNKANDLWRSRGREKSAKEGLKLVTDQTLPDAGFRMEGTEQDEKLKKAIDKLPENQKQVLMLRYYSNLKFVEIAEMLGCPLNTALGRMHKAILKLRQVMGE
jgi:RNA polymerase sigma-70 factor, ECF subfamily